MPHPPVSPRADLSPTACVAVIGGGVAGLSAAETLARSGFTVTVYERMPSPARKFLMAGRGGLNLTHSEPLDAFLARYREAAAWLAPAIRAFAPSDLRAWCESLGVETFVGSSGRVFPRGMKASPLLRAWLRRLQDAGVVFRLRHTWRGWDAQGALLFEDETGGLRTVRPDATLLALGGASWPRLGSDGGWVEVLRGAGVEVASLRPANCGFVAPWTPAFAARFAGQPLKPVAASWDGRRVQGEVTITRTGVEGGLVYAFSAELRRAIEAEGRAVWSLDLRPGVEEAALAAALAAPRGKQTLSNFLRKKAGLSPLALGILREGVAGASLPADPAALAALVKAAPVILTQTAPLARAISSAGGIARAEIDDAFMLRKKPGVFVAGEMMDWEAPTGGYLLQACFSTGVAAARGIAAFIASRAR